MTIDPGALHLEILGEGGDRRGSQPGLKTPQILNQALCLTQSASSNTQDKTDEHFFTEGCGCTANPDDEWIGSYYTGEIFFLAIRTTIF